MGRQVRDGGPQAGDTTLKLAVTGATGFVGRHVVAELERRGLEATLITRSPSTAPKRGTGFHVVGLDLSSMPPDPFETIVRPETLIHLAWDGLPNYRSMRHLEHELPVQDEFLNALVHGGLKNLVVTGTCLEYGMQSGSLHEELEARPVTAYGQAKNTLRVKLQDAQRKAQFNLTWARLFYLYGGGQAPSSLLPQLEAAVRRGDEAFDMSGGEQLRDYSSVSDAARVLVSLAPTAADNGVVNVCSGVPISVNQLVEKEIAEKGWSIRLNRGHYPYPDYEPMEYWGDRRKMDRCLRSRRVP